MKLVPISEEDGKALERVIPEVSPEVYGALWRQADWTVKSEPWNETSDGELFQFEDRQGCLWEGYFAFGESCLLRLVRSQSDEELSEVGGYLELQFLSSDFLQGHDYELNVRYAPEAWDECERDVIVLRSFHPNGGIAHPSEEEVLLFTEALAVLENKMREREDSDDR